MKRILWGFVLSLTVLVFPALADDAGARQRPIEDFLSKQGTYCVHLGGNPACALFEPPVGNILGWIKIEDGVRVFAKVDYAGLADRYLGGILGTTFEGSVTERPLPDGRADVSVRLRTRNALAWVSGRTRTATGGWSAPFPLFGHTAPAVAAGAQPALADCEFRIDFINPAMGADLPDLTQFSFDPRYVGLRTFESMQAHGSGPLVGGAPGELVIQMVGLFETYGNIAAARGARYGDDWDAPTTQGIFKDQGWPGGVLQLLPVGSFR